jgi:UDP-glucose 4-epimerase
VGGTNVARHLVTGGAGFIGSHLTKALLARGDDVIVIDNQTGGWRENVPLEATFLDYDLTFVSLDMIFEAWKPTHVWHLAAYAAEGLSHWVREHNVKNNWLASTRLINAALKYGVERFTFTSSMAVYGSQPPPFTEDYMPMPEDPYGIAKFSVEQDLKAAGKVFDLPWVIFRPHNVYGPYQNIGDPYRNVVGIFMRQAMQGEPMTIYGDGFQTRAFSYISDIISPMVRSIGVPEAVGKIFNIGGEDVISIETLARTVQTFFPGSTVDYLPKRYEVEHAFCDHTKARRWIGFKPEVDLVTGLGWMAEWAEKAGIRWSKTPSIELRRDLPPFWEKWAK